MTVTDLQLNFRAALLAVAPIAERVDIPWRRPDAYDEWDDIATALFESLVVSSLRWSLPEDIRENLCFPPYDLLLGSYQNLGTIEVVHPELSPGRWVFHAFGTESKPFDIVETRLLDDDGSPLADELDSCPVSGAQFYFRFFRRDGHRIMREIDL